MGGGYDKMMCLRTHDYTRTQACRCACFHRRLSWQGGRRLWRGSITNCSVAFVYVWSKSSTVCSCALTNTEAAWKFHQISVLRMRTEAVQKWDAAYKRSGKNWKFKGHVIACSKGQDTLQRSYLLWSGFIFLHVIWRDCAQTRQVLTDYTLVQPWRWHPSQHMSSRSLCVWTATKASEDSL